MTTKKDREYEEKVLAWRAGRYDSLVRENGWLALAGLYWLNEGRNLVGSNPMCEVVLPERAPTFIGVVELKGKTVRLTAAEGVQVKVNGRLAQKAVLKSSMEAKPSFVTWKETLRMVVHEHAGRHAVRVWDNERAERFSLPPLKWFPLNKHFRIPARYTCYKKPKTIEHPDTFGDMIEAAVDGYVTFRFEGKTYRLDASEMEDRTLFIKFRDLTSMSSDWVWETDTQHQWSYFSGSASSVLGPWVASLLGRRVLITGATGGVGQLAIQLAAASGSASRAAARSSGTTRFSTSSSMVQAPFAFARSTAARPAGVIRPAAVSRSTRALLVLAQPLRGLRGADEVASVERMEAFRPHADLGHGLAGGGEARRSRAPEGAAAPAR